MGHGALPLAAGGSLASPRDREVVSSPWGGNTVAVAASMCAATMLRMAVAARPSAWLQSGAASHRGEMASSRLTWLGLGLGLG